MYRGWKERLKAFIPAYAVLPLLCCLAFNGLIYWGAGSLTAQLRHFDFTTSLDRRVPLIPEFVSIYLGCYLFWGFNYLLIARQGKEYCMRFVLADLLSRIICAAFFFLLPTTNVRPELTGDGLWTRLLGMVYQIDAPTRLFPSIHCLVSWFCYIGLRGRRAIPAWYRGVSLVLALLVIVSTQATKQHYLVDAAGAVLIAELSFYIGFHTKWYRVLMKWFDMASSHIFNRKGSITVERE